VELNPQWHSYCDADFVTDSNADADSITITITITITISNAKSDTQPDAEFDAKAYPDTKTHPNDASDTHSNGIRPPGLVATNLIYQPPPGKRTIDDIAVNEHWRNVIYF